jgi:hypothetical protein
MWWILVTQNLHQSECLPQHTTLICKISGNRLRNFRIGVTDCHPRKKKPNLRNYRLCSAYRGHLGRGQTRNFRCRRTLYGRYVIVQLVGREYLTLCEVEVFGKGSIKQCSQHTICHRVPVIHTLWQLPAIHLNTLQHI